MIMMLGDIERTKELLHEHINGMDRAWGEAGAGLFREQLDSQISSLRSIVVRIENMIIEALDINNGTSVDGFETETIPFDWSHLGDNDMRLIVSLWQEHFKAIDSAVDNGDFLTERVLAEMRDDAKACWKRITNSWDDKADNIAQITREVVEDGS